MILFYFQNVHQIWITSYYKNIAIFLISLNTVNISLLIYHYMQVLLVDKLWFMNTIPYHMFNYLGNFRICFHIINDTDMRPFLCSWDINYCIPKKSLKQAYGNTISLTTDDWNMQYAFSYVRVLYLSCI